MQEKQLFTPLRHFAGADRVSKLKGRHAIPDGHFKAIKQHVKVNACTAAPRDTRRSWRRREDGLNKLGGRVEGEITAGRAWKKVTPSMNTMRQVGCHQSLVLPCLVVVEGMRKAAKIKILLPANRLNKLKFSLAESTLYMHRRHRGPPSRAQPAVTVNKCGYPDRLMATETPLASRCCSRH